MAGKLNNTKWHVPISYTLSTDQHKFNDTSPRIWLHPETDLVVLPNLVPSKNGWIILNNQQTGQQIDMIGKSLIDWISSGFYRVNYDRHLWARIEDALKDFSQIHAINRAQLIDDAINLAKINRTDYARVYRLLNYLQNDTDYYPWHAAHRVFTHLLMKTGNKQVQSYLGVRNDQIRFYPNRYKSIMYQSGLHSIFVTEILQCDNGIQSYNDWRQSVACRQTKTGLYFGLLIQLWRLPRDKCKTVCPIQRQIN